MPQTSKTKTPSRRNRLVQSSREAIDQLAEPVLIRITPGQKKTRRMKRIRFDYLKSTLYRVIYADGFHGGLTPSGKVHMAIFNERKPIARSEVYGITAQQTLGDVQYKIERDGIVREVEASVLMDIDKALALRVWLENLFKKIEALQRTAAASSGQKAAKRK